MDRATNLKTETMKKTFTINISGTVFHIEEDAYEKLQNYLLKLKNYFGNDDEGKEIIADIETRIAELFLEKAKGEPSVVVIGWVDEVIRIMGTPEDFIEQEGEEEPLAGTAKRKRRLYRDPDHRVIGGVCGGLGAYFNMDPVVLRIIFVVLLLINGIGLLAYLILWIAVPKAVTTAQRLEMRGQEVNITNIQKSIREEVDEVKESYQKFRASDKYAKGQEGVSKFGDVVYNVLKVTLRVLVVFFGVMLILTGFFGLIGFLSTLIIGHSFVSSWPLLWSPEFHMPEIMNHFVNPGSLTVGIIAIAVLVGIPLLAVLFVGTKMVFRYKSNNAFIGLGMVGLWLIALLTLVFVSAGQIGNFKNRTSLSSSETINCNSCQTLYLELGEDKYDSYAEADFDMERFKMVSVNGKNILIGQPRLNVEKSGTDDFSVVVRKRARGKDQDEANSNIQDIVYRYVAKDSILTFDPYFLLGNESKWRDQTVDITVKVPEGKTVFLGEKLVEIIYDIENVSNTYDADMVGKYWTMKPEGLTLKGAAAPADSLTHLN